MLMRCYAGGFFKRSFTRGGIMRAVKLSQDDVLVALEALLDHGVCLDDLAQRCGVRPDQLLWYLDRVEDDEWHARWRAMRPRERSRLIVGMWNAGVRKPVSQHGFLVVVHALMMVIGLFILFKQWLCLIVLLRVNRVFRTKPFVQDVLRPV